MPDVYFYNILLIGLCKTKKMEKLRSFLIEMLERGPKPTEYTYGAVIIGYC